MYCRADGRETLVFPSRTRGGYRASFNLHWYFAYRHHVNMMAVNGTYIPQMSQLRAAGGEGGDPGTPCRHDVQGHGIAVAATPGCCSQWHRPRAHLHHAHEQFKTC